MGLDQGTPRSLPYAPATIKLCLAIRVKKKFFCNGTKNTCNNHLCTAVNTVSRTMLLWSKMSYLWENMKGLFSVCLQMWVYKVSKHWMHASNACCSNYLPLWAGYITTNIKWHALIYTRFYIYVGLEALPAEPDENDTCSSVELWSVAVGCVVVAATELGTLTGLLVASSCMFCPVIPVCWIEFCNPRASESPELFPCAKVSLKCSSLRDI